jgi:hypothetical protein
MGDEWGPVRSRSRLSPLGLSRQKRAKLAEEMRRPKRWGIEGLREWRGPDFDCLPARPGLWQGKREGIRGGAQRQASTILLAVILWRLAT